MIERFMTKDLKKRSRSLPAIVALTSFLLLTVSLFLAPAENVHAAGPLGGDFQAKCESLGGISEHAMIDMGRHDFFYCSINGSGVNNSIGGETEAGAITQINEYIENSVAYHCRRTPGKTWNSTENRCEGIDPLVAGTECEVYFNWGAGTDQCPSIIDTARVIFNWVAIGVSTVVVIMVVIGAIQYMTAGGSQEQAKKGIEIIRNAILALVLYMIMWALLNFLVPGGSLFGP